MDKDKIDFKIWDFFYFFKLVSQIHFSQYIIHFELNGPLEI